MANASNASPYILAAGDGTLPNSRTLAAAGGLVLQDTGVEGTATISTVGNLGTINTFSSPGFLVYDDESNLITARQITAGAGINVTAEGGQGTNTIIAVVDDTTVQQVNVLNDAVVAGTRATLNLIPSGSVSITIADNSLENRTDITIDGIVAAPNDATYILQTPNVGLPSAQALSTLDTGLLKVTTSTGVLSTAVADTDYQSASANLISISAVSPDIGSLLVGNGTGFEKFTTSDDPGDVLTSNGSGSLPSWEAPATGNLVVIVSSSVDAVALQTQTTYLITNNSGGPVQFFLPDPIVAPPNPGDWYQIIDGRVSGGWSPGWVVNQNSAQMISIGAYQTPAGTTGSLQSTSNGVGFYSGDSVIIYFLGDDEFLAIPLCGTIAVCTEI